MTVSVTYDELKRMVTLLEGFAAECHEEAVNDALPLEERQRWLSEELAYQTSAKRLRRVLLTEG